LPTTNINNDGFRGPEILQETSDEVYRIFIVGGSTAWGYYVSEDRTIIEYLQENFNQLNAKKRIEVINAAIPAYNSNDELNLIKNKIVKYNPDLVIIYDGLNDVLFPYNATTNVNEVGFLQKILRKHFQFYKTPQVINNIIDPKATNFEANYEKFKKINYDMNARSLLY